MAPPGVVEQNMQTPENPLGGLDHGLTVPVTGDIGLYAYRLTSLFPDHRHYLSQLPASTSTATTDAPSSANNKPHCVRYPTWSL